MKWTLHELDASADLGSVWNAINSAGADLPILDFEFYLGLASVFELSDAKLAVCEDGSEPVAAAILVNEKVGTWQTYQPSQAPLGAWVQRSSVSLTSLLDSLAKSLPASTVLLSASQLDPDIVTRPETNEQLETLDYIETARLSLASRFEDYWNTRGKNLKKNVKRQRNRLEREGTATRLECVKDVSAIGAAVDDYGVLESRGWKHDSGTALHPDNAQGRFYRDLLTRLARVDEAFVMRYFYNDDLVATDLYLERAGVLILLKTTYDETQTTTSPSILLREECFRAFFDDSPYRRIEFYGRVMDWHTKWTSEFRTLYHANFVRYAIAGKLRNLKQMISS